MSWLSELTGGIFLPLCCCTGWGSIEEGASRHAFTVANRFSAQWQNLALGLRFHCVSVGGERLSMSQRGTSACQVFGLPSVHYGRGYVILLCTRLWCIFMKDTLWMTERNVQFSEGTKNLSSYTLSVTSAEAHVPPSTQGWRHTRAQFLNIPCDSGRAYTRLIFIWFNTKHRCNLLI